MLRNYLPGLRDRLSEIESQIFNVADFIHDHVEVAGLEWECAAAVSSTLTLNGFRVTRGACDLETAFLAEYGDPDAPACVAFLCEYDGLPPYGQSCGHNVVSACSIGAGILLKELAEELSTRVLVVGAPAEDGFGGKYQLADGGAFEGVDAALLVYPGWCDDASPRTLFAKTVDIEVHGQAAHAALRPDLGANALDRLLLGYSAVAMLRQHLPSGVRVHGVVGDGGKYPQVVPDYASATFTVRGADPGSLGDACARVERCFKNADDQDDTTVVTRWRDREVLAIRENTELVKAYKRTLKHLGRYNEHLVDYGGGWSTDAGYLSRFVPVLQPQLAMTAPDLSPHSHEFHSASTGSAAQDAIRRGALALAMTALQLVTDPSVKRRVRQELETPG